jgi:hypothetical protein
MSEALLRIVSRGGVRLRVAKFLANLWHGETETELELERSALELADGGGRGRDQRDVRIRAPNRQIPILVLHVDLIGSKRSCLRWLGASSIPLVESSLTGDAPTCR